MCLTWHRTFFCSNYKSDFLVLWKDYSLDTGRVVSVLVFTSFFLSLFNKNNYMNTTQYNTHTHRFPLSQWSLGRDLSFCYRPCTSKTILFNKMAIKQLEQGRVENANTEGGFCRELPDSPRRAINTRTWTENWGKSEVTGLLLPIVMHREVPGSAEPRSVSRVQSRWEAESLVTMFGVDKWPKKAPFFHNQIGKAVGGHRSEAIPPWLKVREFRPVLASSRLKDRCLT